MKIASTQMKSVEDAPRSKLYVLLRQFIKFGVVGVSNNIVSLGVYYVCVAIDPGLYMIGYIVGFIAGVLNSYIWNSKYVFRKTANIKILAKTFICYGVTMFLGSIFLFVVVDAMNISTFVAPILVIALTLPFNFLLNKFWAFR
jgi:putative flippase GtrA